jgi:hypothetical protein
VRAPTQPLTYTFSPHAFGAMLLLPPANAPDTRPLYHISFAPDVFNPNASTTAVRRGGGAENALVGEFERVPVSGSWLGVALSAVQLGRVEGRACGPDQRGAVRGEHGPARVAGPSVPGSWALCTSVARSSRGMVADGARQRGWTWKWRNEQFHHLFWRVDKFMSHVVLVRLRLSSRCEDLSSAIAYSATMCPAVC